METKEKLVMDYATTLKSQIDEYVLTSKEGSKKERKLKKRKLNKAIKDFNDIMGFEAVKLV